MVFLRRFYLSNWVFFLRLGILTMKMSMTLYIHFFHQTKQYVLESKAVLDYLVCQRSGKE